MKRTKIIATLGPACDDETILARMIAAGLNVVRINFSHAQHEALLETVGRVRKAAADAGVHIAHPGRFARAAHPGGRDGWGRHSSGDRQHGHAHARNGGRHARADFRFLPGLANDVRPGAMLLLDDGNLTLAVRELLPAGEVLCEVKFGGALSSKRGINLPGSRVSLPSLTDKDFEDIDFAVAQKFDFLALSFVQSANGRARAPSATRRARGRHSRHRQDRDAECAG